MQIVREIDGEKKKTTIKDSWESSSSDANVTIENGDGNSGCHFALEITGGQIQEGRIEMYGEWERADFIKLLKQIVVEMEEINKK